MLSRDKGVLLLKPEGQIAFASTYFCDLVGIKHDRVAGTFYLDYVFPDDVKVAKTLLRPSELSDQPGLQFRLKRLDGTQVLVNVQRSPLQFTDGRVYAITGTVTKAT
jgi:PAS domain S-box-containing protein